MEGSMRPIMLLSSVWHFLLTAARKMPSTWVRQAGETDLIKSVPPTDQGSLSTETTSAYLETRLPCMHASVGIEISSQNMRYHHIESHPVRLNQGLYTTRATAIKAWKTNGVLLGNCPKFTLSLSGTVQDALQSLYSHQIRKRQEKLDYIHSPAHGCITQPPCVAPSGDCERVIS